MMSLPNNIDVTPLQLGLDCRPPEVHVP
jgi:hypothetical protein